MKRFFSIVTLLLISGILHAQETVSLGVSVGMNMSSLPSVRKNDTVVIDISNQAVKGYQAGLVLRIPVKRFVIQPELFFAMKGGDITYNFSKPDSATLVNSFTKKVRIYNIDIPIMVGFKLVDKESFKMRLMAGPVASLIIDKTVDFNATGVHADLAKTDLNSVIWNVQTGIGLDIWKFTIDARYEFGLSELSKVSVESTKNRAYMLVLGFLF